MTDSPQGFPKIKNVTNLADATFVKDQVGTTIEDLEGTAVTYTPTSDATSVVYELMCAIAWSPDAAASFMNLRLQYSTDNSTWTTYDNSKIFAGNGPENNDNNWHIYSMLFTVPAWTGQRYLRLAARAWSSTSEFTWGRSYSISSGELSGFCPMISVYSVV